MDIKDMVAQSNLRQAGILVGECAKMVQELDELKHKSKALLKEQEAITSRAIHIQMKVTDIFGEITDKLDPSSKVE